MTSTTYSNKLSDFKQGFSLYRWIVRKHSNLAIPYSVILFFALPFVQIFVEMNRIVSSNRSDQDIFIKALYGSVFSAVAIVFALILSATVFSYLHNKRTLDLFGSLPITRRTQFFARYLAILTIVIVPILVMTVTSAIISAFSTPNGTVEVYKGFAWLILSILANVSMLSVFAVCSGTISNVIVSYMTISGLWPMVIAMILYLPNQIIPGFVGFENVDLSILSAFSPIQIVFWGYFKTLLFGTDLSYNFNGVGFVIWWIFFIVACMAICYLLIRGRKSEKAQNGVPIAAPQVIIRSLADFVAGLLGGYILSSIVRAEGSNGTAGTIWFVVGAIIGIVVVHTVLQVIYVHSFARFKRSMTYLVAMFVCVMITYTVLAFGGAGYDVYVPKAEEVKSVSFMVNKNLVVNQTNIEAYMGENTPIDKYVATEAEDIEKIVKLHKLVVEGITENIKKPYSIGNDFISRVDSDFYNADDRGVDFTHLELKYTLNDGRTVSRNYQGYFCFNQETKDMVAEIITDIDYIKQTMAIFNDNLEPVYVEYIMQNDYYVMDGSVYSNSTGMIVEIDESKNATLLVDKYFGGNTVRNRELLQALRTDIEQNLELIECLGMTSTTKYPVIKFDFIPNNEEYASRYAYYSQEHCSIDSRFVNTIAVFEKYGIDREYLFQND